MTCFQIDETVAGTPMGLSDILTAIASIAPKMTWSLLELEARGRLRGNRSVVELERQIAASLDGVKLTGPQFTELAEDLEDVINLLAAGSTTIVLPTSRDPSRLADENDVLLERFDSTYWRLYVHSPEHVTSIRRTFPMARECDSE